MRREPPDMSWARSGAATAARELIISGILGPAMDLYTQREITGRERLASVRAPVLFVANHSSHMDTPTILRALPFTWRRRTAVAAAADYFYSKPVLAAAVSLAFNTVPVVRKGEGVVPDSASDLERLLGQGWSLLVFAEGTRSRDGTVGRLRSGAAVLAAEHDLAIVPVHVGGTHAVMPPGRSWMRRQALRPGERLPQRRRIAIDFGPPIRPAADEHRTEVMERVRLFFDECGAQTTPDKRVARRRAAARG